MSGARHYAREIEKHWTTLLERPVVLGERDWQLICDWHAREIPLGLIVEAMEHLGETLPRKRRKPRNLGALAPLVEEAWHTVVEGRVEAAASGAGKDAPATRAAAQWRRRAEALASDDPLRLLLEELLSRLAAGDSPANCDAALDQALPGRLDDALRAGFDRETERNLADFRDRMSEAAWKTTQERALISAARRRLGLPRLIR